VGRIQGFILKGLVHVKFVVVAANYHTAVIKPVGVLLVGLVAVSGALPVLKGLVECLSGTQV